MAAAIWVNAVLEASMQYALGGIAKLGRPAGSAIRGLADKVATSNGVKSLLRAGGRFGNYVMRAGDEAFEEFLQDALSPVVRNITLGEDNEFDPFTRETGYAALVGALTAGILNIAKGMYQAALGGETVSQGQFKMKQPGEIENPEAAWPYKHNIMDANDMAQFSTMLSNITFLGHKTYTLTAAGEMKLAIDNKVVYTDGNFDRPVISRVIVFNSKHYTEISEARDILENYEKRKSEISKAVRVIEAYFGEGFVNQYVRDDFGNAAGQAGGGEGSNRGAAYPGDKSRTIRGIQFGDDGTEIITYSDGTVERRGGGPSFSLRPPPPPAAAEWPPLMRYTHRILTYSPCCRLRLAASS